MRRFALIANPRAGRGQGVHLAERARAELGRAGCAASVHCTEAPGHATQLARDSAAADVAVVACGGDGTVAEVVTGLLAAQQDVPLGILPLGNANVLARELGIPLDPPGAAAVLVDPRVRRIDVGQANEEVFLAMLGVGYDARVLERVHDLRTRRWLGGGYRIGADFLYLLAGLWEMWRWSRPDLEIGADDEVHRRRCHLTICNTRTYAKGWSVVPDARVDDGQLDAQLRGRSGPLFTAWWLWAARQRRRAPRFLCETLRARRFRIASAQPFAYHLDGDPRGRTRGLDVEVVPDRLAVLVPVERGTESV